MFSEIKLVTLGVRDLDRSIAFFADAFSFEEISRTRVDHEAVSEAWRIPHGIGARFAVMGIPGIDSGMVRLVEWVPVGEHVWDVPARFQDLGPYGINFRVKDVAAAWDTICRAGAREKSKPTYWEGEQNFASWDAQSYDPDGTVLSVFQVMGEIESALGTFAPGYASTEIHSLTLHCSDARRSESFYASLGFESLYDRVIDNLWNFLELPQGTKLHNINLIMRGDRAGGRVELAHYIDWPGRPLKPRTAPPARGPLMMSMKVDNLDLASARMKNLGAKKIGSCRYPSPPFGDVTAATFFGPDDEVIEIFEAA